MKRLKLLGECIERIGGSKNIFLCVFVEKETHRDTHIYIEEIGKTHEKALPRSP